MSSLDKLKEDINEIRGQLPIETPAQLYLRKGDKYIDSYDPVYEITVNEHSIDIDGFMHNKYNHSFEEFDRIYIVPNGDEPVELAKRSK